MHRRGGGSPYQPWAVTGLCRLVSTSAPTIFRSVHFSCLNSKWYLMVRVLHFIVKIRMSVFCLDCSSTWTPVTSADKKKTASIWGDCWRCYWFTDGEQMRVKIVVNYWHTHAHTVQNVTEICDEERNSRDEAVVFFLSEGSGSLSWRRWMSIMSSLSTSWKDHNPEIIQQ